jgi:peptide/nickel transport system substrate-binding protein
VLAACGGDEEPAATTAAPAAAAPETTAAAAAPEATAAMEETTTTAMMEEAPMEFESIALAQVGGWNSLDSNKTTAGALSTGQHMMEGLLIKLPDRSLIPGLAAELPQKVDETTYTVKVRTDRTFSDGSPITAEDMAFAYERLRVEGFGSPFRQYITFIDSIDVVADDQLQFNLTQAVPEDVLFHRMSAIKTVPKAVWLEMGGTEYSVNPVPSSGSMMVAAPFDHNLNKFKRYDGYEGPQPLAAIDISYAAIPEVQTRLVQTEAGQSQIFDGVSPQLYRSIQDSPNLELGVARETSFLEIIMFNTTRPPFDNQLVRQAAMYSIDAQQLIDVGLAGEGRIARSPLPPESDRFIEPSIQYTYDPEKSLALLAEAGVETPLDFELGIVEWAYVNPQAPLFAQQMKKGGFAPRLLVDSIDARWASDIEPANYDAWVATIGFEVFSFDPDMLFRGWWSGLADLANFTTPGVPKLTEFLDMALAESDFDKQNEHYAAANEILLEEAGSAPILFQPISHAWHKSVAGYQMPQTLGMTLFGVHPSGM